MSDLVGSINWGVYDSLIGVDAFDTFFQELITWKKSKGGLDRYGEDNLTEGFTTLSLNCLVSYNVFRDWPLTQFSQSGSVDKESMMVILNMKNLSDNGYLNADGYFDFDPAADRFVHRGIVYKPSGDTYTAQAQDKPLLFYMIVQRETISTGKAYHENI